MHDDTIKITKGKRDELERELLALKEKRGSISERVATARAYGDLKENAEYHAARDEQGRNEGRIQEIEYMLKHATLIERTQTETADLGSTVTVQKSTTGESATYMLVSPQEADMTAGKISIASPLGSGLMGKRRGESCTITTPKGSTVYTVTAIA